MRATVPPSASGSRQAPAAASTEADQRPGHRDEVLLARSLGFLLDLGDAAEQEDHHPLDRQPEGEADRGVAELVGQQRGREQDGEGEGHRVRAGGADAVDGLLDQLRVGERDQQRDEQPGRGQEERHAEEAADRQARRLGPDLALARPRRWLGHASMVPARGVRSRCRARVVAPQGRRDLP